MENIVRCPRCNKQYIGEEREEHQNCFVGVKEIPISYIFTIEKEGGRKITIAMGLDGIIYRLVKGLTTLSDESLQQDRKHKSDDNLTEPITDYVINLG